jgi:peptidoglycan/LPS O-acetylase OafA/YrhL
MVGRVAAERPGAARRWRPDIQGLRAVAVLLVVAYHAGVPGLGGGYVGVDVFFVISGFLITGQLVRSRERRGRVDFAGFYLGRIRRLLPSAAVVIVATLVAGRILLSPFQIRSLLKDALAAVFYVVNYRFAFQGTVYQEVATAPSAFQHLWSLAVEEQFYLLWPALIALCAWKARRHSRAVLGAVLAALAATSLALSVALTAANPSLAYFSLQTRAWEFCAGAGVALAAGPLARLPRRVAAVLSWAGLSGIVVAGTVYGAGTPFPGIAALLPVAATATVIAAGCPPDAATSPGAEQVLGWRPAQWLGELSYPWYLWHWPLIVLVPEAVGHPLAWPALAALSVGALGLAFVTLHLVERPIRNARSWGAWVFRRPAWGGAGLWTALALTVLAVSLSLPSLNIGTNRRVTATATPTTLPKLLEKALTTTKAPKDLTPKLSTAGDDTPISTRDGSSCYAQLLVVTQPSCVYGDPSGSKTVALIGDSHAQQWLPALDVYAKARDLKIVSWTKAACSLADLKEANTTLKREFKECDQWRTITMRRVLALHPALVVVSQSDNIPARQYTNAQWSSATAKMMTTFAKSGLKSVYILDTPLATTDIPTCVSEHLDNVESCVRPNNRTKYQYAGRHSAVKDALADAHIPTVEPLDWMCTPTACPVIVDGVLVYRDSSHLTATYSRFLAPLMAEVLKAGGLST